jgi:hypothetical protein
MLLWFVLTGLVVSALVGIRAFRIWRRRIRLPAVAQELGLAYDVNDPFDTLALPFDVLHRGERNDISCVMHGELAGVETRLFRYEFFEGAGHHLRGYTLGCALVSLAGPCPPVALRPAFYYGRVDRNGAGVIELGDESFRRHFIVSADDEDFASRLLEPETQQWLLALEPRPLVEVRNGLLLVAISLPSTERWARPAEIARAFATRTTAAVLASNGASRRPDSSRS